MSGSSPERSENDQLIDQAIDSLDVIDAYNRFAGKGTVPPTPKTEGIKVRCPNPAHPDRDPSAWINTEKQTWYCGGCEEGGDKYDIAAWHFGLPVPGYKTGKAFHDLRRKIAESQGYVFQPNVTGKATVIPPAPPEPTGPDGATHTSPAPEVTEPAEPIAIPAGDLEDPGALSEIELDWKRVVPAGTFLDTWMRQTTIDDVPEEYHFWNGMLAIASAIGREATLLDFRPVYGNLFICFLGRTGSGKSKATYLLDQLLDRALPYDHSDAFSSGILRVKSPASAEALIWSFKKELEDPSTPKKTNLYPVKGLVDFNELSSLVGRANRMGNVLVPTLMQFYDMEGTVETVSRTHGTEKAVDPFACAVTTSQPKALRGLLSASDAASGFLNRWFFAAGKSKPRFAVGGRSVDVEPAVEPLKQVQRWAVTAGELSWSQEALDLFTSFFHREIEPIKDKDETDLLNRLDLFMKKLILLFSANLMTDRVEVEAVEQAIRMLSYILACYSIPGAVVGSTLQQDVRESIMYIVTDHQSKTGNGASNRDIQQRIKSKKYPLDLYKRTLQYMVEIEELVLMPTPPGARGRPTTRYGVPSVEDAKEYLSRQYQRASAEKAKAKKGAAK